jgi:hypothetical protein
MPLTAWKAHDDSVGQRASAVDTVNSLRSCPMLIITPSREKTNSQTLSTQSDMLRKWMRSLLSKLARTKLRPLHFRPSSTSRV